MLKMLEKLLQQKKTGQKALSVLVDPDNIVDDYQLQNLVKLCVECRVDYFFVGGSLIMQDALAGVVNYLKSNSNIPVTLFPGNNMHLDAHADAILFLSLISGRNAEMLIGQHVVAAPFLRKSNLEILPTGYLLIDGGQGTTVSYMSNTTPIPSDKPGIAACTAIAGEMLGLKLMYLDAGSGAKKAVSSRMIAQVAKNVNCPIIVGGGITTPYMAKDAFDAGADVVVIGNGIEKNPNLIVEVSEVIHEYNKVLNVH